MVAQAVGLAAAELLGGRDVGGEDQANPESLFGAGLEQWSEGVSEGGGGGDDPLVGGRRGHGFGAGEQSEEEKHPYEERLDSVHGRSPSMFTPRFTGQSGVRRER
jgi:hypothetical protein